MTELGQARIEIGDIMASAIMAQGPFGLYKQIPASPAIPTPGMNPLLKLTITPYSKSIINGQERTMAADTGDLSFQNKRAKT